MEHLAVIGLGYVGLPLAVEFGKHVDVIGFDISQHRIDTLQRGHDYTEEVSDAEIASAKKLTFSHQPEALRAANIFIITVPTPVDNHHIPDLKPLFAASQTVAKYLKKGDIVIYESTVYPGCTEEECVPVLEKESGLTYNVDFFCGYTPERINPGDKQRRLPDIKKITSGSTPEIAKRVDDLYKKIVRAGTHLVSSIKVAEAAKVIENSQRDINIAFVNELALIFERMNLDTNEVLEAAGTKWNFLPFKPGLVGGHCIGVDPYYLTHKAESLGYHPEVILAGRRINDNMGFYVAARVAKLLTKQKVSISGANILLLGITFKENCKDIRNSKVADIYAELKEFGTNVDVYDPQANPREVKEEYNIELIKTLDKKYDAIVLTVAHTEFLQLPWATWKTSVPVIFDVKSVLDKKYVTDRL